MKIQSSNIFRHITCSKTNQDAADGSNQDAADGSTQDADADFAREQWTMAESVSFIDVFVFVYAIYHVWSCLNCLESGAVLLRY